jgi:hypothetical protein
LKIVAVFTEQEGGGFERPSRLANAESKELTIKLPRQVLGL